MRRTFATALLSAFLLAVLGSVGCGQGASHDTTGGAPPAAAGQPAAGGQAPATAQPAAADVTSGDTNVDVGQVRVQLSVAQRPIVAGQKTRFCVRTEIDGIPVDLAKGQLALTMDAPGSGNSYPLTESEGCYAADVVLPASTTANTRWYATVEGVVDDHPVTARFQFDVTKPTE